MHLMSRSISAVRHVLLCALVVTAPISHAQDVNKTALLQSLRQGGLVILMRHAASPRTPPDKAQAQPDNTTLERQLDEEGRTTAAAMGKALRDLKIPVGKVLSSPTYRALETIRLAQLPTPQTFEQLGDGGQSMQATSAAQASWLQQQVRQWPKGNDTVIVTHFPNITAAFPDYSKGIADGEALVLGSDGKDGVRLVARLKIDEWATQGATV